MNKRLLLGITVTLIILVTFILIIKKVNFSFRIKKGKIISVSSLSNKAIELETKAELLEAKSLYQRLINEFANSRQISDWQKKVEELNIKLLFSPILTDQSILYQIKPNDTLTKIAKEFNTTVELIMRSNNLTADKILPGRKIKIWKAPFSIVVDKSQNILILKTDEEVFKTYIVSTGINNSTPVGNFKIVNKLINPTWFKAGVIVPPDSPENILGSRWLGFNLPGYGIHGTTDPQTLGKQVTGGCIRMLNSDIEELFTIIPLETEVTIVD